MKVRNKMMRVNNMRLVVDKMYQEKPTAMNELIKLWPGEIKQVEHIRSSSNFVFMVNYNGDEKFLRFSHETDKSKSSIEAEMDFILYLNKKGLSVALPELSKNNFYVETIETNDGKFNGVLFEKAKGKYINEEDLTLQHFFKWGEVTAKIHKASKDFKPNPQRKRQTWIDEIHQANQMFSEKDDYIKHELANLTDWIKSLNLTKENYGLIHYDLCTDNIFWEEDAPCLIDFDDAAYYPFTADIAFGIEDYLGKINSKDNPKLLKYIEGYQSVNELPENWYYEVMQFYKLMYALKYTRMLRSYSNTTPETELPWTHKMREKHMPWFEKIRNNFKNKVYDIE